jgi:hypothetical protein
LLFTNAAPLRGYQCCAPPHAAGHASGATNVSPILDWDFIPGLIHLLFSEFENHFYQKPKKYLTNFA